MTGNARVVLSLVSLLAIPTGGQAQEPKTVRIDTLSVMDTLYHLSGGGANSLALIDEINGGVVLIDTKRPGWGQAVRDALDGVTDLPVTMVINTNAHPDHAGSNGEFGTAGLIVAHENTKANMARMDLYSGTNAASLPTKTFADRFSLLEDIDRIELYHFGPAHTDGDIIVVFPAKGVAYLGGLFPSKATPVIEGGTIYGICSYGQLRGLNAETGERLWETQEATGERRRWVSGFLVRNGDRVFINNDRGDLIIARLSPSGYEEISRTHLITPTSRPGNRRELRYVSWVHPAYANGHIYVRNDEEMISASLNQADYQ